MWPLTKPPCLFGQCSFDKPTFQEMEGRLDRCAIGGRSDARVERDRLHREPGKAQCKLAVARCRGVFPESACEGFFVKKHLQNYTSSTSSHPHLCTITFSPISLLIFTSAHLHLCSSSHPRIYISAHLHLHTSTSLLIFTSSHLHLTSSPLALLNFLSSSSHPHISLHLLNFLS